LHGLFFGGVGNDDAASGLLLFFDAANDDAVFILSRLTV